MHGWSGSTITSPARNFKKWKGYFSTSADRRSLLTPWNSGNAMSCSYIDAIAQTLSSCYFNRAITSSTVSVSCSPVAISFRAMVPLANSFSPTMAT